MICGDLCGETKECLQKEIQAQAYDICSECEGLLAGRRMGKVFREREREDENPC
jgi:hypothetical protein